MSVLGESNILDLSFKAFSSQEDSSSKKFSCDDYENITNQFSNVLTQQVNYEPKENSYSPSEYVYKEETFEDTDTCENVQSVSEQNRTKVTDRSEISGREYHYNNKQSSKDVISPSSEHINFRDKVEQLAYSSKDISQILGDRKLSSEGISRQKLKLEKILEQGDIQASVLKKDSVDKSQLKIDLSNRLGELHGKTQKTDSVNSLKEKLEGLLKSISDKTQKQTEMLNIAKQTKQEQAAVETALKKNELLKAHSGEITESLIDLNIEDMSVSKSESSKVLKGQLSEVAAKASLKEVDVANNGENSFMNQQQESHEGMNSPLNSLNSLLSSNNSVSKTGGVNNTEFNRLLSSMEQQHNADVDVLNQVVNNMKHNMTSINGKNSISMILNPQSLGRLNIDLISHNGILSAEIRTDNDHTKELLSKNIESLKQSLQEQGVTVGNMIVKTQESSLSNNNFTKDFSQDNMKGFDFGNNNKTGEQGQNLNQGERHSDYKQDLLNEEHNNMTLTENVHNGLVDYTI